MVFTTKGFFEIAIKGWSEWDLNALTDRAIRL